MNKKGFISISVVYSFFLVFVAIILGIIVSYANRRIMMNEIKKDAKELLESKSNFNCFSAGITKLNECIIYAYGGEEKISLQEEPDFTNITTAGEYGLYIAEDNYGTSYYFRGNVQDNYVKFGQNYDGEDIYWRIVRINGNGTIRLIYDGTTLKPNGPEIEWDVRLNSSIGNSKYNDIGQGVADKRYVGYTYESTSSSAHEDSTIKKFVDSWYKKNLMDYYSQYLADSYFCNDRSLNQESIYYPYEHAAHNRLYEKPTLICDSINDMYTVNDLSYGNARLKYPIAILTADEYIMAGGNLSRINKTYYLFGPDTWTMTPTFNASYKGYSSLWIVDSNGALSAWYPEAGIEIYYPDIKSFPVRPVINLKSDVEIKKGDGTIDSPYVLEEVDY